jgi:hypothetical protein
VRMRGVTVLEVDWASEEVPDLDEPQLNLVLYMYLSVFVYTLNTLIVRLE